DRTAPGRIEIRASTLPFAGVGLHTRSLIKRSTTMMPARSPRKPFAAALAAALIVCAGGIKPANAEVKLDSQNGRYALSPVADGVIRLDTKTGDVSTCSNTGTGWVCYAV